MNINSRKGFKVRKTFSIGGVLFSNEVLYVGKTSYVLQFYRWKQENLVRWLDSWGIYRFKYDLGLNRVNRVAIKALPSYNSPKNCNKLTVFIMAKLEYIFFIIEQ